MLEINKEQLTKGRAQLVSELSQMEGQALTLNKRIRETRKKLEAVDCLLSPNEYDSANKDEATESVSPGFIAQSADGRQARGGNKFTPVYEYWPAILSSLIELGGSGSADDVIERVGNKLGTILTAADREMLPSGVDIRWRNRVQWQRLNMLKRGLLRRDSPRGRWEITEEGRRWLDNLQKRLPNSNN